MGLLTKKQCEIDMEVQLTAPDGHYVIGHANPVKGTSYHCTGFITGISESVIKVRWRNGNTNRYKDNELELVNKPSLEHNINRCQSIW